MGEYKTEVKNKTVYSTQKMSDDRKSISQYEFEKKENGWYIIHWNHNVDAPFPKRNEMYIPSEVVEQILLVESTKDGLAGE